jgi:endonuclease YncB( thermonuclease family)
MGETMRRLLCLCVLLLASLTAAQAQPAPETGVVIGVIDGDTLDVELESGEEARVRLIGIDTPESGEACYGQAMQVHAILVGDVVTLVRDVSETDRYGRLLRYVFAGGVFVNAELVRRGYAEAMDYPPDTAFSSLFHALQDEAEANGYGCLNEGVGAPDEPLTLQDIVGEVYYVSGSSINVRACERTSCDRVAALPWGAVVTVLAQVEGEAVNGSTDWYQVLMANGTGGFIHSSLVTAGIAPTPRPAAVNAPAAQPVAPPAAGQPISTPVPAPVSTPAPAPGFACNCSRTCGQMSCEEAYFQLNQCGCRERDGDADGKPCESQCGG